jgi:hypothetical protein
MKYEIEHQTNQGGERIEHKIKCSCEKFFHWTQSATDFEPSVVEATQQVECGEVITNTDDSQPLSPVNSETKEGEPEASSESEERAEHAVELSHAQPSDLPEFSVATKRRLRFYEGLQEDAILENRKSLIIHALTEEALLLGAST